MSKYTQVNYWLIESAVKAIRNSDIEMIKYYIDEGFNPNEEVPSCDYPFGVACYVGNLEVVKLLLKNGCEPYCYRSYRDTPLHYAADGGRLEVVKLLISLGHKVDAKNCAGQTPLDAARYAGKVDVIDYLEGKEAKQKLEILTKKLEEMEQKLNAVVAAQKEQANDPEHQAKKPRLTGSFGIAEF